MSGHFPTCLVHKVSGSKRGSIQLLNTYVINTLTLTNLVVILTKCQSILDTFDDIDNTLDMFICFLRNVLDKHIPWHEK